MAVPPTSPGKTAPGSPGRSTSDMPTKRRARFDRWLASGRSLASGPIARASGTSLAIRLASLALLFAQAVLTARLLGPAGYGTVASVLAVVHILVMFAILGMGSLAVREIPVRLTARQPKELAAFVRFSFLLVLGCSVLIALVAATLAIPVLGGNMLTGFAAILGGLLIVPLAMLALLKGWAQGFGRIALSLLPADVVRPALLVIVLGFAAFTGVRFAPEDYFIWALASALVALFIAAIALWRDKLRELPKPAGTPHARRSLANAMPFLGIGLAAILQGEINTLLLAALAGPEETGLFQPVARLLPILTLPVQAATFAYAPRMAELREQGEFERIRSITRIFTLTTGFLTLALALVICIAGPWLMLAFGRDFVASAPLLWIVAGGVVVSTFFGPMGHLLTMCGKGREAFLSQLCGVFANLILALWLVPRVGATGAAIAMAASLVVLTSITFWAARARLDVYSHETSGVQA
ncbi:hypothetical protein HME9302_01707 [Alteripontixanthobacter maritimus]|uniref:Uncharacterized protein n=1 Tax=Alteripontixanthobacter maritimus TaxID=2161824 RepID=A0A369QC60_9SPHN|nr:oligosaccharide flippase family protein [Alteripontixanthobacter maritimus]RDC60499.1 hypothetical protein HME9302_01707 [Alteripontixanthobacter maritimus]